MAEYQTCLRTQPEVLCNLIDKHQLLSQGSMLFTHSGLRNREGPRSVLPQRGIICIWIMSEGFLLNTHLKQSSKHSDAVRYTSVSFKAYSISHHILHSHHTEFWHLSTVTGTEAIIHLYVYQNSIIDDISLWLNYTFCTNNLWLMAGIHTYKPQ